MALKADQGAREQLERWVVVVPFVVHLGRALLPRIRAACSGRRDRHSLPWRTPKIFFHLTA
jgi:hypothetical protein